MWDIWPYLYQENMVPVDDLAQAVSEEYGGFYDWVVDTASVDGKWYSVPHGNSSSAFAYRISLVEEAGIEDPKNNFPTTYEDLFALGKTLKEMGKPFGQAMGHSQGDPPAFAYPFMWAHGAHGGGGRRHDRRHQQAGVRRSTPGLHPALEGCL